MIAVIQRVSEACVCVDGQSVGSCRRGLLVLLGVAEGDTVQDADALVRKIVKLRVFEDSAGKMNLSLEDIGGEILCVSNFTLLAAYKKGNRPDYTGAARPAEASALYDYFCSECARCAPTSRGIFGADMKIQIQADGPVTICMDSKKIIGKSE